jgi:predicted transcriptional regulator
MSVAELAKRVKRDHAEVQADAERLTSIGLIDRTESGALLFPYVGVHLELDWRSAA